MIARRRLGVLTALMLTMPIALTVWAAPPPAGQLRESIDQALKILDSRALSSAPRAQERRAALRKIAADMFDFTEMTKRALGQHWQARTAAEREEMVALFSELLQRSYASKIEAYSGERITFIGESVDGDLATVKTRIVTKQGTEIPVEYRMMRANDRWLTYDVTIENVSLVANYRGQFNKILQGRGAYPELVRRLREACGQRAEEANPTRSAQR